MITRSNVTHISDQDNIREGIEQRNLDVNAMILIIIIQSMMMIYIFNNSNNKLNLI